MDNVFVFDNNEYEEMRLGKCIKKEQLSFSIPKNDDRVKLVDTSTNKERFVNAIIYNSNANKLNVSREMYNNREEKTYTKSEVLSFLNKQIGNLEMKEAIIMRELDWKKETIVKHDRYYGYDYQIIPMDFITKFNKNEFQLTDILRIGLPVKKRAVIEEVKICYDKKDFKTLETKIGSTYLIKSSGNIETNFENIE